MQNNEWLAGLSWLDITLTSKLQMAKQLCKLLFCVGSLCDWRSIHHWLFHVCWHALAQKCWQCLTSVGPSISQSCCFCDAQKLYPTSLCTLTSMAFKNWLFWWLCWSQICWRNVSLPHSCTDYPNLVPLKIACQICKYTQKSNLSAGSLSHPAVGTCLDRSLLVHKSQHGLLCLCLPRNFHWSELPHG